MKLGAEFVWRRSAFANETGITAHVWPTGQALQTAARNDADLVLVHDPEAEKEFIATGDGIDRHQIAWNDFIVVGPRSDPTQIASTHDAVAASEAIASAQAPFVSRGDKSGTDALEHRL
jgi:tungstate transport system substrate-binding protein